MKAIIKIIAVASISLLCTSCIDIYQHFTATDKKNVHVYTQMTFSKTLFGMMSAMSGDSNELNYEDLLGDFSSDSFSEYEELGIQLKPINTEMDIGYIVEYDFQKNNKTYNSYIKEKGISFFPMIMNGMIVIDIDFDTMDSQPAETDSYTQAFLSTAKYRISIDKSVKPTINEARLFVDDLNILLQSNDYGNGFLIDIPLYEIISKKSQIIIK